MTLIVFVAFVAVVFASCIMLDKIRGKEVDEKALERLEFVKKHLALTESDFRQGKITLEEYETEKNFLWEELDEIEEEIND